MRTFLSFLWKAAVGAAVIVVVFTSLALAHVGPFHSTSSHGTAGGKTTTPIVHKSPDVKRTSPATPPASASSTPAPVAGTVTTAACTAQPSAPMMVGVTLTQPAGSSASVNMLTGLSHTYNTVIYNGAAVSSTVMNQWLDTACANQRVGDITLTSFTPGWVTAVSGNADLSAFLVYQNSLSNPTESGTISLAQQIKTETSKPVWCMVDWPGLPTASANYNALKSYLSGGYCSTVTPVYLPLPGNRTYGPVSSYSMIARVSMRLNPGNPFAVLDGLDTQISEPAMFKQFGFFPGAPTPAQVAHSVALLARNCARGFFVYTEERLPQFGPGFSPADNIPYLNSLVSGINF